MADQERTIQTKAARRVRAVQVPAKEHEVVFRRENGSFTPLEGPALRDEDPIELDVHQINRILRSSKSACSHRDGISGELAKRISTLLVTRYGHDAVRHPKPRHMKAFTKQQQRHDCGNSPGSKASVPSSLAGSVPGPRTNPTHEDVDSKTQGTGATGDRVSRTALGVSGSSGTRMAMVRHAIGTADSDIDETSSDCYSDLDGDLKP